jgi:photosystem II stability/assembly factor-like uncharacterized protein
MTSGMIYNQGPASSGATSRRCKSNRAALMAALFVFAIVAVRAADVLPRMLLLDGVVIGSEVVAVGERGAIIHSADNGRTWQRSASPVRTTLTGVDFAPLAAPRLGWAVGHDALIVVTTDGGRTWVKQYQGENLQDSFLDVLALDAQRVIAVGAYGLFVITTDGGKTWSRNKINDDDYHLNRITRGPAGTLYVAGEHGTLLRSSDAGTTWAPIAAPYDGSFYGIVSLDRHTLLAHGLRGRVYLTVDDGRSWQRVTSPTEGLIATAVKLKSNHVVLAGQARTMIESRDNGKTLVASANALLTGVAELVELPDGNLLALGEAGAIVLPKP